MRFSFWPAAGNPWNELVETCRHAEATGWDGIWFADHFMPNAADTSAPVAEVMTTLAGLAACVPRVRLGSLVVGNTYRSPAVLAKMAANVDIISGGRLILGLGAGWQENEHDAYGIPFYTIGGRLRRLEEAVQIVKSLVANDNTTFEGRYYQIVDAPLAPKPVQRPLPLLIGGGGEQVTMRIAAQYADEWNVWGAPERLRQKIGVLEGHCADLGRDPHSIKRSAQALVFMSDDPAVTERASAMPMPAIAGNVDQLREIMAAYQEAGVDEFIVPDRTFGAGEQARATMDR
ncbi:MAG: TIGR03560 family F420-dependent LLM class oxidoreductase, partial [Dehalococcoidia bacterium]